MMENMLKHMLGALGLTEGDIKQLALFGIKEATEKLNGEVKYKVEEEDGKKVVYLLIKLEGVDEL